MTSEGPERENESGGLLFARRAGAHGFTGPQDRGLTWSWLVVALATFLLMATYAGLFGIPPLPGGVIWILAWLALIPMLSGFVLTGMPRYEFRERGVRVWRWFRGWRRYPVDADTSVIFRFGHPSGLGYACRLILGPDPESPGTMVFRSFRRKDWPRLLEVAIRYSRPRAERKLVKLRAGEGAFWLTGIRLDPDGIRFRPGPGGERVLLPYETIDGFEAEDGTFRIKARGDTAIVGDAFKPNYLAGRLVLEELMNPVAN